MKKQLFFICLLFPNLIFCLAPRLFTISSRVSPAPLHQRNSHSQARAVTAALFGTLGASTSNDEFWRVADLFKNNEKVFGKKLDHLKVPAQLDNVGALNRDVLKKHELTPWDVIIDVCYRDRFPADALGLYFDNLIIYQGYTHCRWQELRTFYTDHKAFPLTQKATPLDQTIPDHRKLVRRVAYCCNKFGMNFDTKNIFISEKANDLCLPTLLSLNPNVSFKDSLYNIGCSFSQTRLLTIAQRAALLLAYNLQLLKTPPYKESREMASKIELEAARVLYNARDGAELFVQYMKPLPDKYFNDLGQFVVRNNLVSYEIFRKVFLQPLSQANHDLSQLFYNAILNNPTLLQDKFVHFLKIMETTAEHTEANKNTNFSNHYRFLELVALSHEQAKSGKPTLEADYKRWLKSS